MFKEWLEVHKDDYFRYWAHKMGFTPYELEQKFQDQSWLENDECMYGYIVDHVVLPDNDVMIGLSENKDDEYISYYKLSAVDLALSKEDNEE